MIEWDLTWVLGGGAGLIALLIIAYFYIKDVETSKRLRSFEKSIEELNKQLYRLQKKLKDDEAETLAEQSRARDELHEEIKGILDAEATKNRRAISQIETRIEELHERLEDKIMGLDERVKELGYFPSSPNGVDEGRILGMFKDGWSIDAIAKELRIGKGEVEFTLKLANIDNS
ncbi:MAG: hypothetical protein ACTTJS_05465 [Wolinella sp.]